MKSINILTILSIVVSCSFANADTTCKGVTSDGEDVTYTLLSQAGGMQPPPGMVIRSEVWELEGKVIGENTDRYMQGVTVTGHPGRFVGALKKPTTSKKGHIITKKYKQNAIVIIGGDAQMQVLMSCVQQSFDIPMP